MKHRPFFKYTGSKWLVSGKLPAPRENIVELFAGSACYATRWLDREVKLVETDSDIASLWAWLISGPSNEIGNLPVDLKPGTDIWTLDLSRPARELMRRWQRTGNNTCWTVSKWIGANSGFWCGSTRDHLARQVELIRHWRIFHVDAFDWVQNHGVSFDTTVIVDPPYQSISRLYRSKPIDYKVLGAWCQVAPCHVIAHDLTSATWLPFTSIADIPTGRRDGKNAAKRSSEGVWTNE
jgi:hypothetical protein